MLNKTKAIILMMLFGGGVRATDKQNYNSIIATIVDGGLKAEPAQRKTYIQQECEKQLARSKTQCIMHATQRLMRTLAIIEAGAIEMNEKILEWLEGCTDPNQRHCLIQQCINDGYDVMNCARLQHSTHQYTRVSL